MISKTANSINFILQHTSQKRDLVFWMFVRLLAALLPLFTIYQFSHVIKLIEAKTEFSEIILYMVSIFIVRIIDNFLRIRSNTKLDFLISNLSFEVHNYFLMNFKPESKEERHVAIQSIRNFADATIKTLSLFKHPGIDSIVSVIFIPIALFFIDFRAFVITIAYVVVYLLINYFTSQRYKELRDFQDTKTESYYAKLQESNDVDLEQNTFTRHFMRLTNWNFIEWLTLQNTAVFFYSLILVFQIYQVVGGYTHISDLVLVVGYVSQTQTFLNSFTDIWYGLGDMYVALKHLAKNQSVSAISLEDLI